jgi:shikimate kinase
MRQPDAENADKAQGRAWVTEFMNKEFQVVDKDKTTVISHEAPAPRPQMPGGGILYIIGLPGSGKSAVAERLARELGCPALSLPQDDPGEALDHILASGPAVVEVPHKLLLGEAFRQRLQSTGRVLYLMASVEALAGRLAATPEEQNAVRERLGRLRSSYEPLMMQTLHLMAPADAPLGEVLADVLERVRM